MPYVISKACVKCGVCLTECPTGSIIEGTDQYYIDADTCQDHAACVNVCPVDAIALRPEALATTARGAGRGEAESEEEEED